LIILEYLINKIIISKLKMKNLDVGVKGLGMYIGSWDLSDDI